jgi:hypothetical protein
MHVLAASQSRSLKVVAYLLPDAQSDSEVFQRLSFGQLCDQPPWPRAATGPGVVAVPELHGHSLALGLRLAAHGTPSSAVPSPAVDCPCRRGLRSSGRSARWPPLMRATTPAVSFFCSASAWALSFFDLQLNLRVCLGQRNLLGMATLAGSGGRDFTRPCELLPRLPGCRGPLVAVLRRKRLPAIHTFGAPGRVPSSEG